MFRRQLAVALIALATITMAACTSPTAPTSTRAGTYEGTGN